MTIAIWNRARCIREQATEQHVPDAAFGHDSRKAAAHDRPKTFHLPGLIPEEATAAEKEERCADHDKQDFRQRIHGSPYSVCL
jgi:hypothetical protein